MSQAAPYAYLTLVQARQQLANRLYDPAQVFWQPAELTAYIVEALRTWNALTSYWRGDFTFQSQQGVTWYDLTNADGSMPNTLRPLTVTDDTLYRVMQFHLLEPSTGVNPWSGSSAQFTADDLINAVQRRRDEVLSATACTQTRHLVGAVAGRITLPDTVIDVRRMAYLPTQFVLTGAGYGTGLYGFGLYGFSALPGIGTPQPSVVWPDDAWSEQSYNRLYPLVPAGAPSTPLTYLLSSQPPLSFDTDAPPSFAGSYELLTVDGGPTFVAATPQTLLVPDDWTHVIKWGALADLFGRESNARDDLRAQYCEQRYRMGLALLTDASALLTARIGNVPLQIDSVRGADLYRTTWQTTLQATPDTMLHAGLNLVALAPVPDAGPPLAGQPYMFTLSVVENAPVPVQDTDLVQVSRGDLDALLDYAQHLAAFKQGGAEFTSTMQHLKRFLTQAALYNRKLNELGEYTSVLYGLSAREHQMNPVTVPESASEGA